MEKNEGFENIKVFLLQYSADIISCRSSIWNFWCHIFCELEQVDFKSQTLSSPAL